MASGFELRLKALSAQGPRAWIYKSLVFDMGMLVDDVLLPWTVQAIETGIQASFTAGAIAKEVRSLLGDGSQRTIRFYSSRADFVSGRKFGAGPDTLSGTIGPSGATTWLPGMARRDHPEERPIEPAQRTDLRLYLSPVGGTGVSLLGEDGRYHPAYSDLTGTLWHELHHLAAPDYEQHLKGSPPYEPYWETAMNDISAGFPSAAWEPIARRMVPLWTRQWVAVPCLGVAVA